MTIHAWPDHSRCAADPEPDDEDNGPWCRGSTPPAWEAP